MVKNIVLCSDGTGNKGGYGDDSNVYKLYRYVDIHNKNHPQISYYDNGVGTNEDGESVKQNKFWRAISGAFGFGFENNVRDLYEYLAINYEAGDQIYVFGFSRGASTVRAFTGLIQDCGLLNKYDQDDKRKNPEEFQKQIRQAIQVYKKRPAEKPDKSYNEYKSEKAYQAYKSLADDFKRNYAIKNDFAPNGNLKIHFLGVWDTVSALGFPKDWSLLFDWFFSGADKLSERIWPHNYYNFHLNEDIDYACQALAIDDKRQTFLPKVWRENEGNEGSVEQVWFAGIHSNVGGGFPRNGLSNVALSWMMAQANKRKLVFITDTLKDAGDYANVQGKMYNSRDGFAIYYRYQPRDIQDICKDRLSGKVKIHNTVMDRLNTGIADYKPTFLPAEFEVVDTAGKIRQNIKNDPDQWDRYKQEAQSLVKKQQYLYRIFVESTVVLFAIVLCFWANPPTSVQSYLNSGTTDNVFFLNAWFHTLLTYIFPVIFENFLTYILCVQGWIFWVMVVILYGMFKIRDSLATKLNKVLSKTRSIVLSQLEDS